MRKKMIHRITFKINVISSLLFILLFSISILSYGVNIEVVPSTIQFNYEEGFANDALAISDDNGMPIVDPEWDGVNPSHACAYIMGQRDRKIKVYFSSNYSGKMNLIINLTYSNIEKGIGKICNKFIPNYDGDAITLDFYDTLPQSVGKYEFTWTWDIYAMPTEPSTYCAGSKTSTTTHTYYTLLCEPIAPMTIPWEGVLNKACVWASGKQIDSDVLTQLTTKLYTESGLDYVPDGTHYFRVYDIKINNYVHIFYLSDFLRDWDIADCEDMSMFLTILSSSIGGSLTQTRRIDGFFDTKSITPVGYSNPINTTWHFHQVGWKDNVYDACISLNTPTARIPINENIDNPYKKDLLNTCYNCQQTWNPYDPFRLGEKDPYFGHLSYIE